MVVVIMGGNDIVESGGGRSEESIEIRDNLIVSLAAGSPVDQDGCPVGADDELA